MSRNETASKSNGKRKRQEDEEEEEKSVDEGGRQAESDSGVNAANDTKSQSVPNADPLAQINGISPNVVLADGEEKEISSQTRFTF